MVYVPAGAFWMGSEDYDPDAADDEKPQHDVHLDAFRIGMTEVANAQYRLCEEADACQPPTFCNWGAPTYNDGSKADHPVVCVSWHEAKSYYQWAGARLPTEAEWERWRGGPMGAGIRGATARRIAAKHSLVIATGRRCPLEANRPAPALTVPWTWQAMSGSG